MEDAQLREAEFAYSKILDTADAYQEAYDAELLKQIKELYNLAISGQLDKADELLCNGEITHAAEQAAELAMTLLHII